jgi:Uma2 family endonuclease
VVPNWRRNAREKWLWSAKPASSAKNVGFGYPATAKTPTRPEDGNFEGVPDLIVEVLSPKTRRLDRTVKLAAYRDAGVPEVWFADPRPRTIQVLVLSADGKEDVERGVYGIGKTVDSAFLPGLRLQVDLIFPDSVPEAPRYSLSHNT